MGQRSRVKNDPVYNCTPKDKKQDLTYHRKLDLGYVWGHEAVISTTFFFYKPCKLQEVAGIFRRKPSLTKKSVYRSKLWRNFNVHDTGLLDGEK